MYSWGHGSTQGQGTPPLHMNRIICGPLNRSSKNHELIWLKEGLSDDRQTNHRASNVLHGLNGIVSTDCLKRLKTKYLRWQMKGWHRKETPASSLERLYSGPGLGALHHHWGEQCLKWALSLLLCTEEWMVGRMTRKKYSSFILTPTDCFTCLMWSSFCVNGVPPFHRCQLLPPIKI